MNSIYAEVVTQRRITNAGPVDQYLVVFPGATPMGDKTAVDFGDEQWLAGEVASTYNIGVDRRDEDLAASPPPHLDTMEEPKNWGATLTLNSVIYNQALQVRCSTCGMNANDQCVDENNDALPALTVHQSRENECPF